MQCAYIDVDIGIDIDIDIDAIRCKPETLNSTPQAWLLMAVHVCSLKETSQEVAGTGALGL